MDADKNFFILDQERQSIRTLTTTLNQFSRPCTFWKVADSQDKQ